ncbi:hypothetical protein ACXM0N_27295 [Peribacillus simplex]
MMHFLLNLITDMGKEIFVAVATSLIPVCVRQEKEKEPLILARSQWFFF